MPGVPAALSESARAQVGELGELFAHRVAILPPYGRFRREDRDTVWGAGQSSASIWPRTRQSTWARSESPLSASTAATPESLRRSAVRGSTRPPNTTVGTCAALA